MSGGTLALDTDRLHPLQMNPSSLGLSFPFCIKGRLVTSSGRGGSFLSTNGIKNMSSFSLLKLITECTVWVGLPGGAGRDFSWDSEW